MKDFYRPGPQRLRRSAGRVEQNGFRGSGLFRPSPTAVQERHPSPDTRKHPERGGSQRGSGAPRESVANAEPVRTRRRNPAGRAMSAPSSSLHAPHPAVERRRCARPQEILHPIDRGWNDTSRICRRRRSGTIPDRYRRARDHGAAARAP